LLDVESVIGGSAGLSRTVLEYTLQMKRIVDRAKEPGFDETDWESLAGFVAIEEFVRVEPFKDVMRWPDYVSFLTGWAPRSHWECSLRRITETADSLFLELEERSEPGDSCNAANSLSVFAFDASPTLRRLDVYLQLPRSSRSGAL
jgi:hypothetical protein